MVRLLVPISQFQLNDSKNANHSQMMWDCARFIRSTLVSKLEKNDHMCGTLAYHNLIEKLGPNIFNSLNFELEQGRTSLYGISNTGIATLLQDPIGNFEIKSASLSTGQPLFGSSMFIGIQTLNNELQFMFSFIEPVIARSSVELFIERFLNSLKELAAQ